MTLVAIADVSDDNGLAYMLIDTLSQKTSLSRRGVQNAVAGLIDKGILLRKERMHRSSIFKIVVDSLPIGRPTPPTERELSDDHNWDKLQGASPAPRKVEGAPRAPQGAPPAPQGARRAHIHPVNTPVDTPDSPLSYGKDPPEGERDLLGDLVVGDDSDDGLDEYVKAGWNDLATEFPKLSKIVSLGPNRTDVIETRAKQFAKGAGIEATPREVWDMVFKAIRLQPNARGEGRVKAGYDKPYAITFDEVLRRGRIASLIERTPNEILSARDNFHPETGKRMGEGEKAGNLAVANLLRRRRGVS